jgi:hypothetical protein
MQVSAWSKAYYVSLRYEFPATKDHLSGNIRSVERGRAERVAQIADSWLFLGFWRSANQQRVLLHLDRDLLDKLHATRTNVQDLPLPLHKIPITTFKQKLTKIPISTKIPIKQKLNVGYGD